MLLHNHTRLDTHVKNVRKKLPTRTGLAGKEVSPIKSRVAAGVCPWHAAEEVASLAVAIIHEVPDCAGSSD
jgi:hypothetical protein